MDPTVSLIIDIKSFTFGLHTELQNQNTFAKKDLVFKSTQS